MTARCGGSPKMVTVPKLFLPITRNRLIILILPFELQPFLLHHLYRILSRNPDGRGEAGGTGASSPRPF